jgi:uncharacterized protein (TIGR01777 family)
MAKKVLITGGSGLVGRHLSDKLAEHGYEVAHLSRYKSKASKYPTYLWDISSGLIDEAAFNNVDYVVHLAGAGVADKRWTDERKKVLASSRIDSAHLIYDHLKNKKQKIEAFISASAIGIYGFETGSILLKEDRKQLGDDFLATLTKKWELAADQFADISTRVVKLRIGLVLAESGGLLDKLVPITKFGLGSAFGSGDQYMSWIHIEDLVNMFISAIEQDTMKGVYNAVAPNPTTNKEFLQTLSDVLNRPFFLPNTPKFLMRMALGELASAVTGGNNVSSEKISQSGFKFKFPVLSESLKDLLR